LSPTISETAEARRAVLTINSTVIFVGAFTLTALLHESGHFVSYLSFGAHPTLYFNRVEADDSTISRTGVIVSAMAGPAVSLVQGMLCAWWVRRRSQNQGADLFLQWLTLFGFINFFGYVMLTPLSSVGDTGKVAGLLGSPMWLNVLVAVAGIAILVALVIRLDLQFRGFLSGEPAARERARWINAVVFFPIVVGSAVNVAFAFPIPTAISAIYPATSSLTVLAGFSALMKARRPDLPPPPAARSILWGWCAVTVLLLVINRLLVRGV
jgi:hypothetical protein